ncbi:hypothetical protein HSISB1_1204 [Streptococcus sp. HSISB1]|nr:hypothetical protein HSISB1_1204 [Streptococcus sp. HSISB1]
MNLILSLINYRKIYEANYFIGHLEAMLTYQDMFAVTCLNFFKKLLIILKKIK